MNDAKVVVEMSVDKIKKKSVIYTNSSQRYHSKMNECSFQLCLNNPALCNNKEKLITLCRQKLDNEGYSYSKKKSRSKVFGSGSVDISSELKKKTMSADIRAKRIEELTADITSLEDRMKLLHKQRVRDEQLKQYLRASAMEEEIAKIRTEKRKKEEEVKLIKKKQAKASWYKGKTSSTSSTSSDEKCLSRSLSTVWAKKDEVAVNDEEMDELRTSASDIEVIEPDPKLIETGTSSEKALQDISNDNPVFF